MQRKDLSWPVIYRRRTYVRTSLSHMEHATFAATDLRYAMGLVGKYQNPSLLIYYTITIDEPKRSFASVVTSATYRGTAYPTQAYPRLYSSLNFLPPSEQQIHPRRLAAKAKLEDESCQHHRICLSSRWYCIYGSKSRSSSSPSREPSSEHLERLNSRSSCSEPHRNVRILGHQVRSGAHWRSEV